ncbi:hypothetical protein CS379_13215 [Methylobacterium frigidaeris]|nr:hypothetical protein CS379_13215 [Methylobacterium frigidaeris]
MREREGGDGSQRSAIQSIAAKIGCSGETLRDWVRQSERDQDVRPGQTTDERERIRALEREVREPRQADEILREASVVCAIAELGRRLRLMIAFIDEHREVYGVEPICRVLAADRPIDELRARCTACRSQDATGSCPQRCRVDDQDSGSHGAPALTMERSPLSISGRSWSRCPESWRSSTRRGAISAQSLSHTLMERRCAQGSPERKAHATSSVHDTHRPNGGYSDRDPHATRMGWVIRANPS